MSSEFIEYVKRGDKIHTELFDKYPELKKFLNSGYSYPSCWFFNRAKINKLMEGNFVVDDVIITADIVNVLLNKIHNQRLSFEF